MPLGIAVFAIDLSPTKHSRCTVEDVACAVAALRDGTLPGLAARTGHGCCVALWGRSAGAIAALQYAARDPTVAALVADSAYSAWSLGDPWGSIHLYPFVILYLGISWVLSIDFPRL